MTSGYTYDTGMLIACERGQRGAWRLHKRAMHHGLVLTVPAAVLAQAWRGGPQADLSRLLRGCAIDALDERGARSAGAACGLSRTADIVDASVVVSAMRRDDDIVTSDVGDLKDIVEAIGSPVNILRI